MGCLPSTQERDWRCEVSSSLHGEIVSSYAAAEGRDVSRAEGHVMTFDDILDQAIEMLQRRGRLTYRTLKRQFQLDDEALEDLKFELIEGQRLATDEHGTVLVWTGEIEATSASAFPPAQTPPQPIIQETHPTTEQPPTNHRSPEAERRQLTVMFCDLVDSTKLSSQ